MSYRRLDLKVFVAAFLLGAVMAAGCASAKWVKPGATEADFERDRIACERDSGLSRPPPLEPAQEPQGAAGTMKHLGEQEQKFEMCLQAKGWRKAGK